LLNVIVAFVMVTELPSTVMLLTGPVNGFSLVVAQSYDLERLLK
jgi:hypothetical protein